ncbi:MAG: hypothetical protein AB7J35_14095 [Dehalococcoidia bacterium]
MTVRNSVITSIVAVFILGGVAGATSVMAQGASASDGSVAPKFTGGCTASATYERGTFDPAVSGGVYAIPKSGTANYSGSVPVEGKDRTTSGKVQIALPLGLPSITVKSWSSDNTDLNSDSGSVTWDIPSIVPGNIEMTVSGYHQDQGVRCEGRIKVKLEGGGLSSGLGLGSVGLTIVSLAGLAWSAVPKPGGL